MTVLRYHRPTTLDEACRLLTDGGPRARLIAGGTAVGILLKEGLLDVDHLVSLDALGLDGVMEERGALRLGATATLEAVRCHPAVGARLPILAEVLGQVASRRIRNVATVGGNLAWAEAASDPPGVLVALGAEATVRSGRGERRVSVRELFQDYFTTTLASDEVLTSVRVPVPERAGIVYIKFTPQSVADKPVLGVTALVRPGEGARCAEARVVVGAAGPTPLSLPDVDAKLCGEPLDGGAATWVAERYAEAARPVSDSRGSEGYKRRMIQVLVRRALRQAWARAEGTR
jgi:carbon-monoxide dehydrogenase medium subunit